MAWRLRAPGSCTLVGYHIIFKAMLPRNKKILQLLKCHILISEKCSAGNTDVSCCSTFHKCDENQGDCDYDSHCKRGLKCGDNNCPLEFPSNYDCCFNPKGKYVFYLHYLITIKQIPNQHKIGCFYFHRNWYLCRFNEMLC